MTAQLSPSKPPSLWHGATVQDTELGLRDDAHFGALRRLAVAAERGLDGTAGHPARVGATAMAIARRLGLDPFSAILLGHAAPLHDIGKLAVPDAIMLKPGPLTEAEFEIVKYHTEAGAAMLAGTGSRLMGLAREIALNHHERWDGGGYPRGLSGEAIPISGRIVALADVFDALTHARPYKDAWPIEQAVGEIRRLRDSHFDPAVVDGFLAVVGTVGLARPELTVV